MAPRKRWSELSARRQAALLTAMSTELALTATALAVLMTTPRGELRGPRGAWLALLAVQPIGPVLVVALARRR